MGGYQPRHGKVGSHRPAFLSRFQRRADDFWGDEDAQTADSVEALDSRGSSTGNGDRGDAGRVPGGGSASDFERGVSQPASGSHAAHESFPESQLVPLPDLGPWRADDLDYDTREWDDVLDQTGFFEQHAS